MKAALLLVIAKIFELHGQGSYQGEFLKDRKPRKIEASLEVLQNVFPYVDANLHRAIRVNELAVIAGVSEKYFISLFKKILGITPGQYINQIKMNRARDYLYEKNIRSSKLPDFWDILIPLRSPKHSKNSTTCLLPNLNNIPQTNKEATGRSGCLPTLVNH